MKARILEAVMTVALVTAIHAAASAGGSLAGPLAPLPEPSTGGPMPAVLERPAEQVGSDLEAAKADELTASNLRREAETLESRVRAQIEVKKKEIEALKARVNLARDRKDEAARLESERGLKVEEAALKLLEKQKEVREAEKNLAEALRELARSAARVHEREQELMNHRGELTKQKSEAGSPARIEQMGRLEKENRDTERRVLDALVEQASRLEEVAKKEKELLSRRYQVFEMQSPSGQP